MARHWHLQPKYKAFCDTTSIYPRVQLLRTTFKLQKTAVKLQVICTRPAEKMHSNCRKIALKVWKTAFKVQESCSRFGKLHSKCKKVALKVWKAAFKLQESCSQSLENCTQTAGKLHSLCENAFKLEKICIQTARKLHSICKNALKLEKICTLSAENLRSIYLRVSLKCTRCKKFASKVQKKNQNHFGKCVVPLVLLSHV